MYANKPVEVYRASCDNCAKSKVRCGKEQPRCQRCTNQGAVCVYSPSQRLRRNRTTNTVAKQSQQNVVSRPDTNNTHSHIPKPQQSPQQQAQPIPSYSSMMPKSIYPDLDSIFNDTSSAPLPEMHWLSDITPIKELQMPPMSSSMSDEDTIMIGTPSIFDTTDATTETSDSSTSSNSPQCSVLALSTLQSLDLPSGSCAMPYSVAQMPSPQHSLGTILKSSQFALKNALQLVACPCLPNANTALLVTSVVFRVLCWYETVLHGSNAPLGSDTTDSQNERRFSDPTWPSGTNNISVPSINIGAYELEVEDRDRMIKHIVLSELEKVSKVLDGFSKKFCSLGEDSKGQFHYGLEIFLRNKHNCTVLAAKESLDGN